MHPIEGVLQYAVIHLLPEEHLPLISQGEHSTSHQLTCVNKLTASSHFGKLSAEQILIFQSVDHLHINPPRG